jgi:hypothetical protein
MSLPIRAGVVSFAVLVGRLSRPVMEAKRRKYAFTRPCLPVSASSCRITRIADRDAGKRLGFSETCKLMVIVRRSDPRSFNKDDSAPWKATRRGC